MGSPSQALACLLAVCTLLAHDAEAQCGGSHCTDDSSCMWSCPCRRCRPGYYCATGTSACPSAAAVLHRCSRCSDKERRCPAGTYSAVHGATNNCIQCAAGRSPNAARTSCTACGPGRFSIDPAHPCTDCPAGKYTLEETATGCTLCAMGKHQEAAGQTSCDACEAGRWAGRAPRLIV